MRVQSAAGGSWLVSVEDKYGWKFGMGRNLVLVDVWCGLWFDVYGRVSCTLVRVIV